MTSSEYQTLLDTRRLILEIISLFLLALVLPLFIRVLVEIVMCREWKTIEYYLGASQFNEAKVVKKKTCINYYL